MSQTSMTSQNTECMFNVPTLSSITTKESTDQFCLILDKNIYTKSIYDGVKVLEKINFNLVSTFIASDMGISFEGRSKYNYLSQLYKLEQQQLETYLKLYKSKQEACETIFNLPRHKWGRVIAKRSLSLGSFHRPTRHTFCKDLYVDYDMKNSQARILQNICIDNKYPHKELDKYIDQSKDLRQEIIDHHNVTKDSAKGLVIIALNGGSYDKWLKDNNILVGKPLKWVYQISNEVSYISEKVFKANDHLKNDVLNIDSEKWANPSEAQRGVFALWYQTIERHLQELAINFLVKTKNFNISYIIPCQDGFMIRKELDYINLIDDIENYILDEMGWKIDFINKPFDEYYPLEEDQNLQLIIPSGEPNLFDQVCNEFEKEHCLIVNQSVFVKTVDNGIKLFTDKQLKVSYGNMAYDKPVLIGKEPGYKAFSFISRWLSCDHPKIRKYQDMQVYPHDKICPDKIFNLWTPFAMEDIKDYVPNIKGRDFILEHINLLCNFEPIVTSYLTKWIAQMIQYPSVKTTCPTLISKEGAGKGSLIEIVKKMFGHKKVCVTTDPLRDIFGTFNEALTDSFLIVLNEIYKSDTNSVIGKMKGLITDPTVWINEKNVKKFEINTYHRFIITTNSDDPIKTTKGDRRNVIIRASDKMIGNCEYFDQLNVYIDDVDTMKTLYDYFKAIPDMDKFKKIKIPVTKYQLNLQEKNQPPLEQWLEQYVSLRYGKNIIEPSCSSLYDDFKDWALLKMPKNYDVGCASTFGSQLANLQCDDAIEKGKRTKAGWHKLLNIPKLKTYFEMADCKFELEDNLENEELGSNSSKDSKDFSKF